MKKLAFGILGIFMVLGGILLTACDNRVSMSVDTDYVEIYTNYVDDANDISNMKEVKVNLENSSAGVGIEVLSGEDRISTPSTATYQGGSNYSFTISAVSGGDAQIKVYSIEDLSLSKIINVKVYTLLSSFEVKTNRKERSDLFAVKGVDKVLNVKDYFDTMPLDVNVNDVKWAFIDSLNNENMQQLVINGQVVAEIVDENILKVYSECDLSELELRAYSQMRPNVYGELSKQNKNSIKVLENSTISSFTLDGDYLKGNEVLSENVQIYKDNQVVTPQITYQLKRNDKDMGKLEGTLVLNTSYKVSLDVIVYKILDDGSLFQMQRESDAEHGVVGYREYFDIQTPNIQGNEEIGKNTYNILIDAQDINSIRKYGNFKIAFKISYEDYAYDIVTNDYQNPKTANETDITIQTIYFPTSLVLTNQEGYTISDAEIYSSYNGGYGFMIKPILYPDEVVKAEDSTINIKVDTIGQGYKVDNLDELIVFYFNGSKLHFSFVNGAWESDRKIPNGYELYISAGSELGGKFSSVISDFVVSFESVLNPNARTNLNLNLYNITSGEDLQLKELKFDDDGEENYVDMQEEYYIPSSRTSDRSLDFKVQINGLAAGVKQNEVVGLTLNYSNHNDFEISKPLIYRTSGNLDAEISDAENPFVVVYFTVSLVGTNFEGQTDVWFSHVTNRTSEHFKIYSFIPATSASVVNADKASSDVHVETYADQGYYFDNETNKIDNGPIVSSSLSKLMLEAGASLPLNFEYQSLQGEIEFRYLSFDAFVQFVLFSLETGDMDEAKRVAEEWFNKPDSTEFVSQAFYSFVNANTPETPFSISENKLILTSNDFKGYVAVIFNVFDENHNPIKLVRLFALESFYSVKYVRPNINTVVLYTEQTLSSSDMSRSMVEISVTFRPDSQTPKYVNNIELIPSEGFEFTTDTEKTTGSLEGSIKENGYYRIDNIRFINNGTTLVFRITALSTKDIDAESIVDILRITYTQNFGGNEFFRDAEVQIEIRNEMRVSKVTWLNKTINGDVYLNTSSNDPSEKSFIISTITSPAKAYDTKLAYYYHSNYGNGNYFDLIPDSTSQTFNLHIDLNQKNGGQGYLYLLPNDMVKSRSGRQILVYEYIEDNGKLVGIPHYIPLASINKYYDLILNGSFGTDDSTHDDDKLVVLDSGEQFYINNYFYNNGQKVYYRDIILKIEISVADGSSDETAIRIYDENGLLKMDSAKHYCVMNDITLNNWKGFNFDSFTGSIFGADGNKTITLLGEESESFMKNIDRNGLNIGTIKNLTFAGNVTSDSEELGFIARRNSGIIENVYIDGYYSSNGVRKYNGSTLVSSSTLKEDAQFVKVGGFVGYNTSTGIIRNSYIFGLDIKALNCYSYLGGFVGHNVGQIENCGFEFYKLQEGKTNFLTIGKNSYLGGLVGLAGNRSRISGSYAYAYSMEDELNSVLVGDVSSYVGAFIGAFDSNSTINESFVFLGTTSAALGRTVGSNNNVTISNSYISFKKNNSYSTKIYISEIVTAIRDTSFTLSQNTGSEWENVVKNLDENIWQLTSIDDSINFGYMYLKNVQQSSSVDFEKVKIQDITDPIKVLSVGADSSSGILFYYNVNVSLTDVQKFELLSLNTISISDLFGITDKEAKSLVVMADNKNITIGTNSIIVQGINQTEFTLTVYSKMNYEKNKQFKLIILNNLPSLITTIEDTQLDDGNVLMLQRTKSRQIVYTYDNSITLGYERFETATNEQLYEIKYGITNESNSYNEKYVIISEDSSILSLSGNACHSNNSITTINTYLYLNLPIMKNGDGLSQYGEKIKEMRNLSFAVSVFEGATNLIVRPDTIEIKAAKYSTFDVELKSDNIQDNILIGLTYNDINTTQIEVEEENRALFKVDENLYIDFNWIKTITETGLYHFRVTVKVFDDYRHRINHDYQNLKILINALSQKSNENFVQKINLVVRTQELQNVSISVYSIEDRELFNSILYLTPESASTSVLTPSSESIIAITATPAFAVMTHFTLTYSLNAENDSKVGSVTLSRLLYNSNYGYYSTSLYTSNIVDGIRVDISNNDKVGNGVYFFRMYLSSSFTTGSSVVLTATYYNGSTILKQVTSHINVDSLAEANIKIEGKSTYLLAKGSSATITIELDEKQELTELVLRHTQTNISLSGTTERPENGKRIYTSVLTAYVDAKVAGGTNGLDSGIFYVYAYVQRTINNKVETKYSRVTVILVDFTIDTDNISLQNGGTVNEVIDGENRNVGIYYAYISHRDALKINYPFNDIIYDKNNNFDVQAVEEIKQKQDDFLTDYSYEDAKAKYYINYAYDRQNGSYKKLSLIEQLYEVDKNSGISTKVYNSTNHTTNTKDFYTVSMDETGSYLNVTGNSEGSQLMKLRTTIICQDVEMVYDYYFYIIVELYTDEDSPKPVYTAEDFIAMENSNDTNQDYILMNDIALENYTPIKTTTNIRSFDGNGFTIHLNSFATQTESALNLALFNNIVETTTLKNIRVNIYNGGQITVNTNQYKTVNIAGFALQNNGIIYNCDVVAYYDKNFNLYKLNDENYAGLVVRYTKGVNNDYYQMQREDITSSVYGFVGTNNKSIMNSRVGGSSFEHIVINGSTNFIATQNIGHRFVIQGQGDVAGFAGINSGYISACFVSEVQIYNQILSSSSRTAGFVLQNTNSIQSSYIEGQKEANNGSDRKNFQNTLSSIDAIGYISGFVYQNSGKIKNSYSNIAITNMPTFASGFVYTNETGAEISLCYSACFIKQTDISQMPFSAISYDGSSLNNGTISFCYFYDIEGEDPTNQMKLESGTKSVTHIGLSNNPQDVFYGFSFASDEDSYDGIWTKSNNGITLVSANKIALSNRSASTDENGVTHVYYNRSIVNLNTMILTDLSYGSIKNPIIIRSAEEFAKATGNAGTIPIASYREYYDNTTVFGNYRIVDNIDLSEIDQDQSGDNKIILTTFEKTFLNGILDGNGFTISNIELGSNKNYENFGLFASLYHARVMNIDFTVKSIHDSQANIVGTLAGTAVNSRIVATSLTLEGRKINDKGYESPIQGNNVVGGLIGMLFGESSLIDVTVTNADVFTSFYDNAKTIYSNKQYVGETLRNLAQSRSSLINNVKQLSYAGGIIGYVDVYDLTSNQYVKYDKSLEMSDYDLIKVHAYDTVNVYAEIAGGLFGYVGDSTYIYDAELKLNSSDGNLNEDGRIINPSYITSKNLFAGGLIGENYGGLFAVSASYSDTIQLEIEQNENAYYQSYASAIRGQQSIFSYTKNDILFSERYNDPLFIGGLVGFMGGGFINVGYSKLNVISHSNQTLAAGGIVGAVGYTKNAFQLTAISNNDIFVNVYFDEVYSSGDLYIDGENGASAGLIGAIGQDTENSTPSIAMKYVMTMNYYSYTGTSTNAKLLGDNSKIDEATRKGLSDNHFMFVGHYLKYNVNSRNDYYKKGEDNTYENVIKTPMSSPVYIIGANNNFYNVTSSFADDISNEMTVGGYYSIQIGSNTNAVNIELNEFGFVKSSTNYTLEKYYNFIKAVHIGTDNMNSMQKAYRRFESYFLSNDWSTNYWQHNQDELFPYIELFETLDIKFWDATIKSTLEVLSDLIQNPQRTVVVRGRINPDDPSNIACQDIDIPNMIANTQENSELLGILNSRKNGNNRNSILGNFKGTLISYNSYMEISGTELGTVKNDSEYGGKVGDDVGIITDRPLCETLDEGSRILDLNIYLVGPSNSEINYSVINSGISSSAIQNVNVTLNSAVSLVAKELEVGDRDSKYAGVFTNGNVTSTSFINTTFTFRNNSEGNGNSEGNINLSSNAEDTDSKLYFGLLAGQIKQENGFNSMVINGLNVVSNSNDSSTVININLNNTCSDLYVGLYAGEISKANEQTGKISISINSLSNININLKGNNEVTGNAYIGGFVGKVTGDIFTFAGSAEATKGGIVINQGIKINSLYAGLAFGQSISNLNISASSIFDLRLSGGIYQTNKDIVTGSAHLGGIVGETIDLSIQSMDMNFSIGCLNDNKLPPQYETLFEQNVYNYNSSIPGESDSIKLSPYIINNINNDNINKENILIGGFAGKINGSASVSGNCNIEGVIDVETKNDKEVDIGGFVGHLMGGFTGQNLIGENSLNISVQSSVSSTGAKSEAKIGGIIGYIPQSEGSVSGENKVEINKDFNEYFKITGNTLLNVPSIKFGGAIGQVGRTNYNIESSSVKINSISFGGTVKIYGNNIGNINGTDGSSDVYVGGIVGQFSDINSQNNISTNSSISNCLTYGDVFIIYPFYVSGSYANEKLLKYNFGGIVGALGTNKDGKSVQINDNSTIMTSFNNRLINKFDDTKKYNVGAIVGKNAESGNYKNNVYSSGVCMAYQVEEGNKDIAYGRVFSDNDKNDSYLGYSSIVAKKDNENIDTTIKEVESKDDILTKFSSLVEETPSGHKLNPYKWNEQSPIFSNENIAGNFHGIKWIALQSSINYKNIGVGEEGRTNAIADNLTNVAFIGNGNTISISDSRTSKIKDEQILGGLVNTLGEKPEAKTNENEIPLSFNIISGLIINLDVKDLDLNTDGDKSLTATYGGVVGKTYSNSFVYGVGVEGTLSVGGKNTQLTLGGIVGHMQGGMINECYSDAEIIYRAKGGNISNEQLTDQGSIAGIANLSDYNNTIKSSYSSGKIKSYVSNDIYSIAGWSDNSNLPTSSPNIKSDIIDCYSISNIEINDFINDITKGDIKAIYESDKVIKNGNLENISEITSLSFNEGSKSQYSLNSKGDIKTIFNSKWYFTPFTNFGYATHGFGYMKNPTVYTREKENTTIPKYNYTEVFYKDVLKYSENRFTEKQSEETNWYFGILNIDKYQQMVNLGSSGYRFRLLNDLILTDDKINESKDFSHSFDGDNHKIDITGYTKSLFKNVTGEDIKIENFVITNANVTGDGILASSVTGNLTNISATGNLNVSGKNIAGGLVGTLTGTGKGLVSVVNIKQVLNGFIIGGVVGQLLNGDISYSSYSGQLINSATNTETTIDKTVTSPAVNGIAYNNWNEFAHQDGDETTLRKVTNDSVKPLSKTDADEKYVNCILGGIAGIAINSTTSFDNCYNNGSILNSYTFAIEETKETKEKSGSFVSGGILGYSEGTVTISNSYNVGLVGTGNYQNAEGYLFAGGIFGYASGAITLSNNINDGPVEAIGKIENVDYSIRNKKHELGAENGIVLGDPYPLEYDFAMIYNPNQLRHVFAYGLGYANGSVTDNGNNSSIDNIKNDGNMGQVIDLKTLSFNRSAIMQNVKLAENVYLFNAIFNCKNDVIYFNGYDSYGVPARVFMTETITRYLAKPLNDYNSSNRFKKDEENHSKDLTFAEVFTKEGNKNFYKGDGGIDGIKDGVNGEITLKDYRENDEIEFENYNRKVYNLEASTEYYASVNFSEYDNVLNSAFGEKLGYSSANNKFGTKYINTSGSIESKIADIQAEIYNNTDEVSSVNVNGMPVAFIKNGNAFSTILNPYSAEFEITINDETIIGDYKEGKFGKRNVDIKTFQNGGEIDYQFCNYTLNDDNSLTIKGTVYFVNPVEGNITVSASINYTSNITTIQLRNNNVEESENNYKIYLDNISNLGELSYDNLLNKAISKNVYTLTINGESETLTCNGSGNDSGRYYITVTKPSIISSLKDFNESQLKIERTYSVTDEITAEVNLTFSSTEKTQDKLNQVKSQTIEWQEYLIAKLNRTAPQEGYNTDIIISLENISTTGFALDLTQLRNKFNETNKLAIDLDEFSLTYNDNDWNVVNKTTDWIIEKEGNNINFKVKDESLGNQNIATLIQNFKDKIMGCDVYYNVKGSRILNSIEFNTTGSLDGILSYDTEPNVDLQNIIVEKDGENINLRYNGSNMSEENEVNREESIVVGGIQFYTQKITINAGEKITKLSLIKDNNSIVGERIIVLDGQDNSKIKLFAHIDSSIDVKDKNITINDKFIINKTSTTMGLIESENKKLIDPNNIHLDDIDVITFEDETYEINKVIFGLTYTDESGEEQKVKCPYCGKADCFYLETNKTQGTKGYSYRIYDCGAVEVEYDVYNANNINLESTMKFSYNGEFKAWKPIKIDNQNDVGFVQYEWEEDGAFNWKNEKIKYFDSYNPTVVLNKITVDLIAQFVKGSEDKIVFVKAPNKKTMQTVQNVENSYNTTDTYYLPLFAGNEPSHDVSHDDHCSNLVYKNQESTDWTTESSWTIKLPDDSGYELYEYDYRYDITYNYNSQEVSVTNAKINGDIIVLENNISVGERNYGELNKKIFGFDYLINYLNSTTAGIFTKNGDKNTIQDVVFDVISGIATTEKNISAFIETNSGTITNVKLYGNLRNVANSEKNIKVFSTFTEFTENVTNFESYLAITGLNASVDKDVKVTLSNNGINNNKEENQNKLQEILIAGSAVKGRNGENDVENNNGGNGKLGGKIESTNNCYARVGLNSIAGFGGNGKNGGYNGTEVLGGAGGGAPGINADDIKGNYKNSTQFGGNGGVGGLGYIDSNNKNVLLSTGGGSAGAFIDGQGAAHGKDGVSNKEYIESSNYNSGKNGFSMLGTKDIPIGSTKGDRGHAGVPTRQIYSWAEGKGRDLSYAFYGPYGAAVGSEKGFVQYWAEKVDETSKIITSPDSKFKFTTSSSGASKTYENELWRNGGFTETSEIYLEVKAQTRFKSQAYYMPEPFWYYFVFKYEITDYWIMTWTSGEALNSAGSFGWSVNPNR